MPSGYDILRAGAEHEDTICALQTGLWSPGREENRRHLHHRYHDNCYPEDSHIYLALRNGRAVGMRGFHGARWEAGTTGELYRGLLAGDAVIAAEHRDRGLVTQILDFAMQDLRGRGYDYLYSLGASRVNVLGLLTKGWRSAGPMLPVGARRTTQGLRQRLRESVGSLPGLWRFKDSQLLHSRRERQPFRNLDRRGSADDVQLSAAPPLELMVDVVQNLGYDGRIRHQRDRAYLGWRYFTNLREYRFLHIDKGPGARAYLALGRLTSPLANFSRVQIVDLEATSPDLRTRLLRHALETGRFSELVTWMSAHPAGDAELLRDLGFVEIDQHERMRGCPCLLVKNLDPDQPAENWQLGDRLLLDPANWDLRLLYSFRA